MRAAHDRLRHDLLDLGRHGSQRRSLTKPLRAAPQQVRHGGGRGESCAGRRASCEPRRRHKRAIGAGERHVTFVLLCSFFYHAQISKTSGPLEFLPSHRDRGVASREARPNARAAMPRKAAVPAPEAAAGENNEAAGPPKVCYLDTFLESARLLRATAHAAAPADPNPQPPTPAPLPSPHEPARRRLPRTQV